MPLSELLAHLERPELESRLRVVTELLKNDFVAEIAPFVPKLSGVQRSLILAEVRNLSTRHRCVM